jgi:hypothetical protein
MKIIFLKMVKISAIYQKRMITYVYVYMYISVYVYICIHLYMYISVYVYICIYTYTNIYMYISVYVYIQSKEDMEESSELDCDMTKNIPDYGDISDDKNLKIEGTFISYNILIY